VSPGRLDPDLLLLAPFFGVAPAWPIGGWVVHNPLGRRVARRCQVREGLGAHLACAQHTDERIAHRLEVGFGRKSRCRVRAVLCASASAETARNAFGAYNSARTRSILTFCNSCRVASQILCRRRSRCSRTPGTGNEQAEYEFDELLHQANTSVVDMMCALRDFLGENAI
jgi:hypothetical protein